MPSSERDHDLLIAGGTVLDPAAAGQHRADVAVKGDRIVRVSPAIPPAPGASVVDASGLIVTPGLVDLHTHVYHGGTFWGVRPDPISSVTGVTTWVDAGSSGAHNLDGLRRSAIEASTVRVLALLNISCIGLVGHDYELTHLGYCDIELAERIVEAHRDIVSGIKVRMGASTVGANGMEPLRRARKVADRLALPLMVHIASAPPALDEVVGELRGGDILTHCFTGQSMGIVDDAGAVRAAARRARDAGVVFDLGHGSGSFTFRTAEAALAAGIVPDVISTDTHQVSVLGPMFDLPTVMSKLLTLGLSLEDVFRAATLSPARVLGQERELGTLAPGTVADISGFEVLHGTYAFWDLARECREGDRLLRNRLTVVSGRVLDRLPSDPPSPAVPWARAGSDAWLLEFVEGLRRRGHTPDAMDCVPSPARPRNAPPDHGGEA